MKEKKKKRVKIFLTMDEELNIEFEKKVLEKCIDKSLLFDSFIREWLKNNK